jgi:hypothetical protein
MERVTWQPCFSESGKLDTSCACICDQLARFLGRSVAVIEDRTRLDYGNFKFVVHLVPLFYRFDYSYIKLLDKR